MAKVTMDDSEYELLKENKRLLEESLKETKRQQSEIDRLNKEKIEILENSKMKVTKVTILESSETLWTAQSDSFALGHLNYLINQSRGYSNDLEFKSIKTVIDAFFKRTVVNKEPVIERVVVGLDDVIREIREELQNNIDSSTREKLDNADKALEAHAVLSKTVDDLREYNSDLLETNKNVLKELEDLKDTKTVNSELSIRLDLCNNILKDIYNVIPYKISSFGNKKTVRKIKQLVEKAIVLEK